MRNLILILICASSYTLQSQEWFDKSCKNIDDSVIPEEFKLSDERNILKIIVNQAGDIEINGSEKTNLNEIKFKEFILDYVTNPDGAKEKADKPEKVIFQLDSYQKDSRTIQKFKNYVYDVYLYLWDKNSGEKYNSTYLNLNCKKREKIFNNYPLKIVDELDQKDKSSAPIRKGVGVPVFGGDTQKN